MSNSTIGRHLQQWRNQRPAGLVSPALLNPGTDRARRIHRRIFTGADRGPLPWGTLPLQTWTAARWWLHARKGQEPRPSLSALESVALRAGVPVGVQRSRLAALQTHHSVPPWEAHLFGLTTEGHFDDWPQYIYSFERSWNYSASAVVLGSSRCARQEAARIQDKAVTNDVLASLGLPVVPTRRVIDLRELRSGIDNALADWGEVFVKPLYGSGGHGAAVVRQSAGRAMTVTSYGRGEPGTAIELAELARHGPWLVQPYLRSPDPLGLGPSHDIITVRVVTRHTDDGRGPVVFSQLLELPMEAGYRMYPIRAGKIDHALLTGADDSTDRAEDNPDLPQLEQLDSWLGSAAVQAHQAFPGLFAIAWDVALTTSGPVFLEGNVGFATRLPQVASGGLLQGL